LRHNEGRDKAESKAPAAPPVSEDQIYNASRLSDRAERGRISPPLIQKLNIEYGTRTVSDALRYMRLIEPSNPAGYLVAMLRNR
jgi:hypothetical protein